MGYKYITHAIIKSPKIQQNMNGLTFEISKNIDTPLIIICNKIVIDGKSHI
jgi:hypothetical protein